MRRLFNFFILLMLLSRWSLAGTCNHVSRLNLLTHDWLCVFEELIELLHNLDVSMLLLFCRTSCVEVREIDIRPVPCLSRSHDVRAAKEFRGKSFVSRSDLKYGAVLPSFSQLFVTLSFCSS